MFTFHKSVIGHLHIKHSIPCEDYSGSFSDPEGRFHIAVVADGHGDPSCFRSDRGSRFASEAAIDGLKSFAQSVMSDEQPSVSLKEKIVNYPRQQTTYIRQLTDTIIASWSDKVAEDLRNDPPTPEQMDGKYLQRKEEGRLEKIYGTTLIAALYLPECLLLLQQGDGRCVVFFENGEIQQPIPWDDRCAGTATTSMCDSDAADCIRYCVIDTDESPVVACFLGSDGVEDAYSDSETDMQGVHTFYKDLLYHICTLDEKELNNFLDEILPQHSVKGRFSKSGSGDDVSVAGIVDKSVASSLIVNYPEDVEKYTLQIEMIWYQAELQGKMRKHGILENRYETALEEYNNGVSRDDELKEQIEVTKKELEAVVEKITGIENDLSQIEQQGVQTTSRMKDDDPSDPIMLQYIYGMYMAAMDYIKGVISEKRNSPCLKNLQEGQKELSEKLEKLQKEQKEEEAVNIVRKENLEKAEQEYREYDMKYREIEERLKELEVNLGLKGDSDD